MKFITAPDPIPVDTNGPFVFLAGGITNCGEWQQEMISFLDQQLTPHSEYNDVVILNPRRNGVDWVDIADQQIKWKFNAIKMSDIFTMWFDGSESIQPICLFELGKALVTKERIVLGVHTKYRRYYDVQYQCALEGKRIDAKDFETYKWAVLKAITNTKK